MAVIIGCNNEHNLQLQSDGTDNASVCVPCVQHVQATPSAVSVMDCVFRHVSCVTDTHSVAITVMNPTALKITVCILYLFHSLCTVRHSASELNFRRLLALHYTPTQVKEVRFEMTTVRKFTDRKSGVVCYKKVLERKISRCRNRWMLLVSLWWNTSCLPRKFCLIFCLKMTCSVAL